MSSDKPSQDAHPVNPPARAGATDADLAGLAPIGLCLLDRDLRFLSLNPRMAQINGQPVEEHLGRTIGELFPADLVELLEPACRRVLVNSEPVVAVEYTGPSLDADSQYWLVSIRLVEHDPDSRTALHLAVEDISLRKRRELAEAEQLRFGQLIAKLSGRFVNIPTEEVDNQIHLALKEVAEFIGVERASLFELRQDGSRHCATLSYAAEGYSPFPTDVELNVQFPYYSSVLAGGKVFRMSSVGDLPEEAALEREYAREEGIKSTIAIPIEIRDSLIQGIDFDAHTTEREWPDELVQRLRLVGELFVKAQDHQRVELEVAALQKRLESENLYLREEIELQHHHHEIIGQSKAIRSILRQVEQVAPTDSTVLIHGETGTGKELVARAIHNISRRHQRAMIRVNCASLPLNLVESELFGRDKGAYTGALTSQAGRFELADGSTIFLDEVSELPLELQAKLLRVLQEGEFERLGSTETRSVDVRVITATNRNLEKEVGEGRFRQDLFYRLNVFPVAIPPLRERREDIPQLVWSFVQEFGEKMGKSVESISTRTMDLLKAAAWPGNVRELRNVIERAMILNSGPEFQVALPQAAVPGPEDVSLALAEVERRHITRVLESTGWRVRGRGGAAELLRLKPTTLESRMSKLDIQRP